MGKNVSRVIKTTLLILFFKSLVTHSNETSFFFCFRMRARPIRIILSNHCLHNLAHKRHRVSNEERVMYITSTHAISGRLFQKKYTNWILIIQWGSFSRFNSSKNALEAFISLLQKGNDFVSKLTVREENTRAFLKLLLTRALLFNKFKQYWNTL